MAPKKDLKAEIKRLINTKPVEKSDYYQLSLFANDNGSFGYTMLSRWKGYTSKGPRRELREAATINPAPTIELFRSIDEPIFVINTKEDLRISFL